MLRMESPYFNDMIASMKVPPKRKGNRYKPYTMRIWCASMKVPPKRKGNFSPAALARRCWRGLNESPSEKEGKFTDSVHDFALAAASMKVPPKRKGNCLLTQSILLPVSSASMKVPPKRKGNLNRAVRLAAHLIAASMKVPPKRKGN